MVWRFHIVFATSPILQWKRCLGRRSGDHGGGFCSGVVGGLAGAAGFATPPAAGVAGGGGWAARGEIFPAATLAIRSTSIRYRGTPTNSIRPLTSIARPHGGVEV